MKKPNKKPSAPIITPIQDIDATPQSNTTEVRFEHSVGRLAKSIFIDGNNASDIQWDSSCVRLTDEDGTRLVIPFSKVTWLVPAPGAGNKS